MRQCHVLKEDTLKMTPVRVTFLTMCSNRLETAEIHKLLNRDKGFGSSQTTGQVGLIEQEGTSVRAIIISGGRGSDFVPKPHTSSNSDGGYSVHLMLVHIL